MYLRRDPLSQFFVKPDTTWTPRVLKDGADSVGALGALNRVYINIGLFSEEWLLHFRALLGGQPISPIPLETAQRNSVYWMATEMQSPNMARYLLAGTDPHYLKDAPGGSAYLADGAATVERGKGVFADRCARCHSSKLPALPAGLDLENANGPHYLDAWNKYWDWTKTDAFKVPMRQMVLANDFLDGNYLSTRAARADYACSASMPAAHSPPMPSAATSGTTSPPSRTRRCHLSARSRSATRSAERRWTIRCRLGAGDTSVRRRW